MSSILVRTLFGVLASASFGIIFNVRGRHILYAGLSGGVGCFVYFLCGGMEEYVAAFLASSAISAYAEVMARRRKTPSTLFLVAGMIPIVPGGGMYNCMLRALEGNLYEAVVTCYNTLLVAGAIAIGIIAVSSVVKIIPRKPG